MIWNLLRRRNTVQRNISVNIVDSIVKAHSLYKELAKKAHPDRHKDKRREAEDIMKELSANKHDYQALLKLREIINQKL